MVWYGKFQQFSLKGFHDTIIFFNRNPLWKSKINRFYNCAISQFLLECYFIQHDAKYFIRWKYSNFSNIPMLLRSQTM